MPADLDGVYLRNTENPVHPSLGHYHPFDGDGMVHVVGFRRREGLLPQPLRAHRRPARRAGGGQSLWAGLAEPPDLALREDGWGARRQMKDASTTDVIVHRGTALTSFYQCGDLYRLDPLTAETLGKATWNGRFPFDWGVSAHPKVDERTGELLFFNYGKEAPYMHYGVVDEADDLVHYVDVPLPGPRLPHDMAFTENYVDPQRLPAVLGPRGARQGRARRALPPRPAEPLRRHPAARADERHPLVRGRPDLRPALRQRLRGRRRDRPRRLLPGRPGAPGQRRWATGGSGPSASSRSTACRPACTAGGSTCAPASSRRSSSPTASPSSA